MELGALGSLNYRMGFPQQQASGQQSIPPQQQGGGQYQIPVEKDPLATRGKLTSDYYNNVGLLRSFLQEHGSDAAKPDYSQEGGGLAFQTFQKLQANVMMSANALKNEQAAENQMRPLQATGQTRLRSGVDTSGLYATDAQNFMPTAIDPLVLEANKELGDPRYTQSDSNRLNAAVRDPKIQYYQQQIQKDPANAEYYQRQIEALLQNTPQVYAPAAFDRGRGAGAKNTPEVEILKKVTNLAQGVWPEGTYSITTKGGKALLENKTYAGEYLGDYQGQDAKGNSKIYRKIVKRWLKDPETGEVTIEFENPDVPREKVSETKGDVIASAIITNNPKYGSASKMYTSARELGLLDDTSSAITERLIPQDAEAIKNQTREKGKSESAAITAKYAEIKKGLETLENPILGNNWITHTLPDGREIQIAKHKGKGGKKFYIKNWEDLGFDKEIEDLSVDDALAYLDDFNYFDRYLGQQAGGANRAAQIKAKYGIK